jgi:hypothetical protein
MLNHFGSLTGAYFPVNNNIMPNASVINGKITPLYKYSSLTIEYISIPIINKLQSNLLAPMSYDGFNNTTIFKSEYNDISKLVNILRTGSGNNTVYYIAGDKSDSTATTPNLTKNYFNNPYQYISVYLLNNLSKTQIQLITFLNNLSETQIVALNESFFINLSETQITGLNNLSIFNIKKYKTITPYFFTNFIIRLSRNQLDYTNINSSSYIFYNIYQYIRETGTDYNITNLPYTFLNNLSSYHIGLWKKFNNNPLNMASMPNKDTTYLLSYIQGLGQTEQANYKPFTDTLQATPATPW